MMERRTKKTVEAFEILERAFGEICPFGESDPRSEHYRAAALEVFIRARAANQISEKEWIDLSRLAGEIHSFYEAAHIIGVSLEVGISLAPIAFVFGNERDRAIVELENPERDLDRFEDIELINELHTKMMQYVRRFHEDGERIVAKRMERLQEILPRSNYGYICHQVGWQLPELTEQERELRENYLLFKSLDGVFADASTEGAWRYMVGDLIIEVEVLPNMQKGGRFILHGHGVIDREAAKDYLRAYAQRVVEAVKNLENLE